MDRLTVLSSITSTLAPVTSSGAVRRLVRSSACCSSTLKVKAEPRPSTLSALISPPIRATSRAVIASPSPVPSWRRVDEASIWLNFSNTWSSRSAGMPMPVSLTTIVSRVRPSRPMPLTSTSTWPVSVNLTALPSKLVMICRMRPTSPT